MLYQILIVWTTFVYCINSGRTTLSTSNCPSKFYLDKTNVTSLSKQQMNSYAQNFYSIYDKNILSSKVQQIVVKGNMIQLNNYVKSQMTIFIIIGILGFSLFVTLSICCTFQKSCPPESIRRDIQKKPYSLTQIRILTVVLVIISVAILTTSSIGFSYIPQLKAGIQNTTCSIYITIDSILNGEKDTGWGGFNNLYIKIGKVAEYLDQSLSSMQTLLSGDQWLIDQMQNMQQKNVEIYKNNKDSKLITPNPITTAQAITNGYDIPTISSRFITSGLGPNGTTGTLVDDIDKGLRISEVLSSQAYQIEIAAKRVIDSSTTLLQNTNSSRSRMQMYISHLNQVIDKTDIFKAKYLEKYFIMGLSFLQSILGVNLIGSLLCLLGIFGVYFFDIFNCRIMSTFGWFLFGLSFFGLMIVLYITLGLGSLGYGFCNYFDLMLHNQSQYNKITYIDSQNIFNKLDSCFYGDGNVLNRFNLGKQMGTVTSLFQHIQQYYDYEDQLSTNYIDKSISVAKITNWMATLQNYRKGIYIDYNQSIKNQDNPNYAVQKLNLYTFGGGQKPVCSKDKWVFDSLNCTNVNEFTYQAGTYLDAQNLTLPTNKTAICISFNEKYESTNRNEWSFSDFTARYKQTRQNCYQTYLTILDYGYSLIRYRNSRINLFRGIYDELQYIYTKNVIFNNNITTFKSKVIKFQNSISNLSNAVSNSIDGLLVSNDCRAIVNNLRFTYNMFCINSMYNIIRIGWCALFLAIFTVIGIIAGYMFSLYFGQIQNNKKIKANFTGNQQQISSEQIIKQKVNSDKQLGTMLEFQKLDTGVRLQKRKKDKKQIISYDSQNSSQDQNPYTKQLKQ